MIDRTELNALKRETVQNPIDYPETGTLGNYASWSGITDRGTFLPPFGTRAREYSLRQLYRDPFNWIAQSAFQGLIKKVKSTPWEIKGKNGVRHYQEVFRNAAVFLVGIGYDVFMSAVLLDYLRQDAGAFIEVIGPGASDKPLKTAPTGLAYLDSLFCYQTGDPTYPVVYQSRLGGLHPLHYTRVIRLIDGVDGDQLRFGYGLCALSRAVSIVYQSIYSGQYVTAKLDDEPPPGFVVATNINRQERDQALAAYTNEQSSNARPTWGRTFWMYGTDPANPAKLDFTSFQQAPEAWSYKEFTDLQVNAFALALGVDIQELWQLTGGNIGSAGQSEILHAKSQGRMYGDLLTQLERRFNDIIPERLEFQFKRHDPLQAKQDADTAAAWAGFALALGDVATPDEKRRIIATNVDAFADAVTDEQGTVIRLNDADLVPDDEDVIASDDSVLNPEANTDPTPSETIDETRVNVGAAERKEIDRAGLKAIQSTRLDFENDFNDLLAGARDDDFGRRRFGIVLRDLIRKYGREAMLDGLSEGGVSDRTLDADDQKTYTKMLLQQSTYVTGLGAQLYRKGGVSNDEADLKPELWWNKSLMPFYQAGIQSADRNGVYEWTLGRTEQSCPTCLHMDGQRHRMKDYVRTGILPQDKSLACGGWMCKCTLNRTTERVRGEFPK